MDTKVTIYSIAKELGYTPSMVSRALSENGKVSEEKRRKVLELAEKYNFKVNKFASRMSQKTIKIGCIIVSKSKRLEEEMLQGFKSAFSDLCDYKINYDVTTVYALNNPLLLNEIKDALAKYRGYDGVIASGFGDKCYTTLINDCNISNLVFLQNVNDEVDFLFASKHNEKLASFCVADIFRNMFNNACGKKVFLYTGNQQSTLHLSAKEAFLEKCSKYQIPVAGEFDMLDDETVLKNNIENFITEDIGGIYITSGNSLALCDYIKNKRSDIFLVCTDTYPELDRYILDGTVAFTVDQNISGQAYYALYNLSMHIIKGQKIEKICYTDFKLTTKSMLEV